MNLGLVFLIAEGCALWVGYWIGFERGAKYMDNKRHARNW